MIPKSLIIRDRDWLDHLHGERCIITGQLASKNETIDPMHIGAFKGMKRSDDEVIPVLHRYHAQAHQQGEMTMLRTHAPDDVLRLAFRAYARELYRQWKVGSDIELP